MEPTCEVVITAPDASWLVDFSRRLVEDRLCAGSHVVTEIRAVYTWQGETVDRPEARVALHTRRSLVPEIVDLANRYHPYQVPCVIALPIADGNPAYLAWIVDETRRPQPIAADPEQG
ncbi:cation tolerance protein CutA [Actinoplanes awajinensis subsp. mycoplanecinus]|uniref:Cation tolerance protein CutA n=1 Tax=Actinoplanes awajinensis subsp. mycoplanecinus TaxID=135947 RepID=A0A124G916_9ACTN|nr:cation tolerance protein CutA [Actinoplanes awajinensis subsp. mycoplanecinus]